jgi:formylglycine-generating enzyme required for sulfatase activity
MACIPAGPFVRGTDGEPSNARPSARIWLQTYYMDLYEVTYEEYESCERAGRCPKSRPRYTDFDHPRMPVQGVRWTDARAYCQAHGKSLPTEAQWEKAARGPDGHLHPWGDEPATCERAIIRDATGRSCGLRKAQSKPEVGRPWDVGSRPPGVYGLYDMVGNSWEWVEDWYTRSYEACGESCLGVDPKGPCDAAEVCPGYRLKIVRGGSWYWDASYATGVVRRAHVPSNEPFHHFGFRCAATAEQADSLRQKSRTPGHSSG